jgi:hypothetical protein
MEKLIKEIPSPRSSYLDHTLSCLRQELGILRRALLPFTDKDNISDRDIRRARRALRERQY